jgi:hypothetical protein
VTGAMFRCPDARITPPMMGKPSYLVVYVTKNKTRFLRF